MSIIQLRAQSPAMRAPAPPSLPAENTKHADAGVPAAVPCNMQFFCVEFIASSEQKEGVLATLTTPGDGVQTRAGRPSGRR